MRNIAAPKQDPLQHYCRTRSRQAAIQTWIQECRGPDHLSVLLQTSLKQSQITQPVWTFWRWSIRSSIHKLNLVAAHSSWYLTLNTANSKKEVKGNSKAASTFHWLLKSHINTTFPTFEVFSSSEKYSHKRTNSHPLLLPIFLQVHPWMRERTFPHAPYEIDYIPALIKCPKT